MIPASICGIKRSLSESPRRRLPGCRVKARRGINRSETDIGFDAHVLKVLIASPATPAASAMGSRRPCTARTAHEPSAVGACLALAGCGVLCPPKYGLALALFTRNLGLIGGIVSAGSYFIRGATFIVGILPDNSRHPSVGFISVAEQSHS
jgi:hypothetical protein